jgi:hypothetical protein
MLNSSSMKRYKAIIGLQIMLNCVRWQMADATGTRPAVPNFISHFTIIFKSSSSIEVNVKRYEFLITMRYCLIGTLKYLHLIIRIENSKFVCE